MCPQSAFGLLSLPGVQALAKSSRTRGNGWLKGFEAYNAADCRPASAIAAVWQSSFALATPRTRAYSRSISSVMEIKQAVVTLPPRKKLALARWMDAQLDDRLGDEDITAIAAEGAGTRRAGNRLSQT